MIGGFVPFLIYFLLLRGDPSYTESVDSGRSVRSVTAENPNPGEYHYFLIVGIYTFLYIRKPGHEA